MEQIDLIAKYPLQLYGTNAIIGVVNACIVTFSGLVLYGTNAIIGVVNACIVTFSGLVINVKGMATPIAGAIIIWI